MFALVKVTQQLVHGLWSDCSEGFHILYLIMFTSIECELHVSNPLQVSASIHRRESSYYQYPEECPHKEKQLTPTYKRRISYLVHKKEQSVTMQTQ